MSACEEAGAPPPGAALVDAFQRLELGAEHFGHAQHLEVAWHYVRSWPLLEAIARFDRDLERFARHHGATDYNRTLTCAFLLLIHERAAALGADHDFHEFRDTAADLFDDARATIQSYYTPELLRTPLAGRAFVLPDAR